MKNATYKKIPMFLTEKADSEHCKICGNKLTKDHFIVYLYDKGMNKAIVVRIRLFYCSACKLPFCTEKHVAMIKEKWPNLILRTTLLSGDVSMKKKIERRERCRKALYEDPENVPILKSKTMIMVDTHHNCDKKKKINEKHKLIHNDGTEEIVLLTYCKSCNHYFIKEKKYEYFKENFSKNYFIIKENYGNISRNHKINTLKKYMKIHVGYNRMGDCCKKEKLKFCNMLMSNCNKEKIICPLWRCSNCGNLYMNEKDYDKLDCPSYYFMSSETNLSQLKRDIGVITPQDFLTRVNVFQCTYGEHHLIDIVAKVKVLRYAGDIKEMSIPAAYCNECDCFYILEEDFQRIKRYGHIICRVIEESYWTKMEKNNRFNLKEESTLHLLGYNVNSNNGLTQKLRWRLLEFIVDEGILSRMEICSHLDNLINISKNKITHKKALEKWQIDRDHISEYVMDNEKVDVNELRIRKYN